MVFRVCELLDACVSIDSHSVELWIKFIIFHIKSQQLDASLSLTYSVIIIGTRCAQTYVLVENIYEMIRFSSWSTVTDILRRKFCCSFRSVVWFNQLNIENNFPKSPVEHEKIPGFIISLLLIIKRITLVEDGPRATCTSSSTNTSNCMVLVHLCNTCAWLQILSCRHVTCR